VPKDPNEIGAMWIKKGNHGDWLSGHVTLDGVKHDIVCFFNDRKTGNQPDWRVLKSVPKGERPMHNANASPVNDDEIPFAWFLPFVFLAGSLFA
jgi:hypothetical protein